MEAETKICQNCKLHFTIEPEDFLFYEKIKVPPPTFCVQCRNQRRLAFRNTHSLYKRKDAFSGADILSIYSADKPVTVIDQKTWWGDSWDPFDYGHDYDFSKPFFAQWKEFRDKFPLQSLSNSKAINSEYCNVAEESYDCYLVSAAWKSERVMYSDAINTTKDCLDLHVVHRSEFCYDDTLCTDSYKLFYSQNCRSCTDSYFLYDCRGCTNCFMSSNLRNQSYRFKNQQLTKEAYLEKMKSINLGSYAIRQQYIAEYDAMVQSAIHRYADIQNSPGSTGNNIEDSKNCKICFDITDGTEDCKYVFWGGIKTKDSYDCGPGIAMGENMYEMFDTGGGSNLIFTSVVYYSSNVEYSFNCYNSSDLFACIGLRSKQYCIFNKQYTKEEYTALVAQIKKHMDDVPFIDKGGRICKYGEFFPVELSPFCYNETVAQDYYPLTKDEALKLGYAWKDHEHKDYQPTITAADLQDDISDVDESIMKQVIECEHKGLCADRCSRAFKIVPDELRFYKRFGIPLPRLCYGCRHYGRLNKRTPMKLWQRTCMCNNAIHGHTEKCLNKFETAYSPDRTEKIYCEQCYQKEVL